MAGQIGRPDDLAARYGGEEFVCLLPDTEATGAQEVAERIPEAVRTAQLPHDASPGAPHVTVSLGVASGHPGGGIIAERMLSLADSLLYMAKADGRNRLCTGSLAAED